ncbi:MAG: hypothetical protein ACFFD9_10870, partial [Candidatus Thorarchaeota archaeon]
ALYLSRRTQIRKLQEELDEKGIEVTDDVGDMPDEEVPHVGVEDVTEPDTYEEPDELPPEGESGGFLDDESESDSELDSYEESDNDFAQD